jgi:AraC-like DNA-binding protein
MHTFNPLFTNADVWVETICATKGGRTEFHSHDYAQLIFPLEGILKVTTHLGAWIAFSQRAIWIPPFVSHKAEVLSDTRVQSLYLKKNLLKEETPTVFQVSPLLKEILCKISSWKGELSHAGREYHLIEVMVDELKDLKSYPFYLIFPMQAQARKLANELNSNPNMNRTLQEWGEIVGASYKTLERAFLKETGITFHQWKQKLRVVHALEKLAQGSSVTEVAYDLGYESPSAFIHMFKKITGNTPSFFKA